jgi:hypothetical protein
MARFIFHTALMLTDVRVKIIRETNRNPNLLTKFGHFYDQSVGTSFEQFCHQFD